MVIRQRRAGGRYWWPGPGGWQMQPAGECRGRGAGRDDVLVKLVLHDGDVLAWMTAADAVRWAGEAVDAHHRGELVAPPRIHADFGDGRLVFTTGRLRGSWFGYRSYDTFPADPGAQVVVVHDETSGQVRAVAVGNELGPRRTGAIGAVAADALAPPGAGIAAVIGAGTQAYTQLWALAAVRELARCGCTPGIRTAAGPSRRGRSPW